MTYEFNDWNIHLPTEKYKWFISSIGSEAIIQLNGHTIAAIEKLNPGEILIKPFSSNIRLHKESSTIAFVSASQG